MIRDLFSIRARLRRYVLWLVDSETRRYRDAADAEQLALMNRLDQLELALTEHSVARSGADAERLALMHRLDKLELVLTEHPAALTIDLSMPPLPSPAVSVIMPTWNRAGIVGAAIRSVQSQHFADWELIVIDDGSEDDTADAVAAFASDPRIRYVHQPHAGQCVARNFGHTLARGALIAYLDSDNLWYPGFLAAAVDLFTQRPQIDSAYGAVVSDLHGARLLFEQFDRAILLKNNFIDTSCFIHRRDLIDRYGRFDPATSPLEDWDLILRYTAHSAPYRLPVAAVRYREVDDKRVTRTQNNSVSTAIVRSKWDRPTEQD